MDFAHVISCLGAQRSRRYKSSEVERSETQTKVILSSLSTPQNVPLVEYVLIELSL